MTIENDKVVLMHYTLKNDAGDVLDTSDGREPLGYLHGKRNIIPGLEKELVGKVAGDKVSAVVSPEEGYGVRQDELVNDVPLTQFQEKEQVQVGNQFQVSTPEGARIATIAKIEGETVTVDFNHPLADMTLHFDVEVVEVRDATAQELEHGHVHAPGGCGGHDH